MWFNTLTVWFLTTKQLADVCLCASSRRLAGRGTQSQTAPRLGHCRANHRAVRVVLSAMVGAMVGVLSAGAVPETARRWWERSRGGSCGNGVAVCWRVLVRAQTAVPNVRLCCSGLTRPPGEAASGLRPHPHAKAGFAATTVTHTFATLPPSRL